MLRNLLKFIVNPILNPINVRVNNSRFEKSCKYLQSLRGIHSGERCFIIGNGPSLCAEDLDKLMNEICFASNRIYQIYDKTDWRPIYYCASDSNIIRICRDEIRKNIEGNKFICLNDIMAYPNVYGASYLKQVGENYYPNMPRFSTDISRCVYSGETVTYVCFQIAAYMGFKEIILLGIDHNYSFNCNPDGTISHQEDVKDHFFEKDKKEFKTLVRPQVQKMILAYEKAKKYADGHGIKIYNATKGGKLEIFERIDFDSLF